MKFSENWLSTLVQSRLTSGDLAHRLTMSGIEIEAIETVAPAFSHVVVAKVLSVEKHPDADRLNVCKVDVGEAQALQIVCGASNVSAGIKVPCARVGAILPAMEIKEAQVRGVLSSGMLCSAKELGLESDSSGLFLLPQEARVGEDFRRCYDLDDKIFTLKITPNRSDCLSLLGIAREISSMTGAKLSLPDFEPTTVSSNKKIEVGVDADEVCPLYCGRVIQGLDLSAQTPEWLKRRIERSGIRSINAVVDVTNYVMLEMGQPLHAFDLSRISGSVSVRFARKGEKIALLNETECALDESVVVIADEERLLAVAGIMGGKESAVSLETSDVFLECAFFEPKGMAGKSRLLGISTDSSYRFERGVDFGATRKALERATQLILSVCGGKSGPITEVQKRLPERNPITLRVGRVRRVLGVNLDPKVIAGILSDLKFDFEPGDEKFTVVPPTYRFDLKIEEDLIEELGRIYGYDNIPALLPESRMSLLPKPESRRSLAFVRQALVGRGYQEVINYSFVDEKWEKDFCANPSPISLMNPIASQMSVMRTSLIGGLIDNLSFNLNRKQPRVRIFETGSCFAKNDSGFEQKDKLAALVYGDVFSEQWAEVSRSADFYDIKSDMEALFSPFETHCEAISHPALHPGRSAVIKVSGKEVGFLGELHPKWVQKYGLPKAPLLFEIDLSAALARKIPLFAEISKFPPVRRDLAIVVDDRISVQTVLDACREILPQGASEVSLFDIYRGKGIEDGKKSLAFKIVLQDAQKTLTDPEVDVIIAQLIEALAKRFDSKLRI